MSKNKKNKLKPKRCPFAPLGNDKRSLSLSLSSQHSDDEQGSDSSQQTILDTTTTPKLTNKDTIQDDKDQHNTVASSTHAPIDAADEDDDDENINDNDKDTPSTLSNTPSTTSSSSSSSTLYPGVPTYPSMLVFVGTTILIWLSEPLLSLVDTTVVGQTVSNAVVQLASLGPATLLTDSLIYTTYFLAIATTNTMANALAANNYRLLQQTASQSLGLAGCMGILVSTIVFGFGRPLTQWLAGSNNGATGTAASMELIRLATQYSQIRCAVAPLAIMGMVAQAICLASLDTTTPALAVVVASLINVVGDLYLVAGCGMGVHGAAIATATASVASTLVLLRQVYRKMGHWRSLMKTTQTNGTEPPATGSDGDTDKASLLREEQIPFLSLPNRSGLMQLVGLAGPIFFVMIGKIVCYSAMTLRATDFGMIELASHNIMMRIFFFYATFGDSLSQASQTFLPRVLVNNNNNNNNKKQVDGSKNNKNNAGVLQLVRRLAILTTAIGLFTCNVSKFVVHRFGTYFTKEGPILSLMKQHSSFMSLSLLLHPVIMLFEGAIIATRDVRFLVGTYAVTMTLLFGQLGFVTNSFGGVWKALFCYQSMRTVQFGARFLFHTLGTRRGQQQQQQHRGNPTNTNTGD